MLQRRGPSDAQSTPAPDAASSRNNTHRAMHDTSQVICTFTDAQHRFGFKKLRAGFGFRYYVQGLRVIAPQSQQVSEEAKSLLKIPLQNEP